MPFDMKTEPKPDPDLDLDPKLSSNSNTDPKKNNFGSTTLL